MALIADILLVAGALAAAFYCLVLSRRLSRFTDLDAGVGGAVAVLSAQVDDLTKILEGAQGAATSSVTSLEDLTGRAETVARQLELFVASMHDLPSQESDSKSASDWEKRKPIFERAVRNADKAQQSSNAKVLPQVAQQIPPENKSEAEPGTLFLRHRAANPAEAE